MCTKFSNNTWHLGSLIKRLSTYTQPQTTKFNLKAPVIHISTAMNLISQDISICRLLFQFTV